VNAPLTVKQAAERLGIKPSTVYELCAARKLRHERHGVGRGTIRIPEEAIDEYRQSVTVVAVVPQTMRKFRHLT
jgi:excisionase family DNA binding protein